MTEIELLAPARDLPTARAAILHGADAIYIGGPGHGARQAAGNSVADITEVVHLAHPYGIKVYVTLNTLLLDPEVKDAYTLAWRLYRAGVDALIIQDIALLAQEMPPIELHASTQCDIRTPDKARMLAAAGMSRLVLPRELSLAQIHDMAEAVPGTGIEAFVHGALCVSYSGDCQMGQVSCGRSGNRGCCPQMCRLPYDLVDGQGQVLQRGRHLLSLRDMCRLDYLEPMLKAGVTSLKIEGRLKDAGYVKNVVAAYSQALDRVIAQHPGLYRRSSQGKVSVNFIPDVNRSFNRGFTPYLLDGKKPLKGTIASFDTPKAVGENIGTVVSVRGSVIEARLTTAVNNGDGISWIDAQGRMQGTRVNCAEGSKLWCNTIPDITPGVTLLRTADTQWSKMLEGDTASRRIPVTMTLSRAHDSLCLSISNALLPRPVTVYSDAIEMSAAKKPQMAVRRDILSRLGDTIYELVGLEDDLGDAVFIPVSVLTQLRRLGIEWLMRTQRATYHYGYRRAEKPLTTPSDLTYHDNVANSVAEAWYRSHGTKNIEAALEAKPQPGRGLKVMTTRHCVRRELGLCQPHKADPLYLVHGRERWRLDFDCDNCQMHVTALAKGTKGPS